MSKQQPSKIVLAALSPDLARSAALATVKAVVTCEKAKRTLLGVVAQAVATITVPLSAAQYDRQFRPYLAQGFAAAVQRKAISERTAGQYTSKLKTAVLALLSTDCRPIAGETFWEFYDRAAEAVTGAKLANGSPVWEASEKRGRKVGAKQPKKTGGGALPGAVAHANTLGGSAGDSGAQEGGFNRHPKVAAALILTGGNEARAQRLVTVLANYTPEFDKWVATILSDQDQASIAKRSHPATPEAPKAAEVVSVSSEPETALAAAMVKAASPKNRKAA